MEIRTPDRLNSLHTGIRSFLDTCSAICEGRVTALIMDAVRVDLWFNTKHPHETSPTTWTEVTVRPKDCLVIVYTGLIRGNPIGMSSKSFNVTHNDMLDYIQSLSVPLEAKAITAPVST